MMMTKKTGVLVWLLALIVGTTAGTQGFAVTNAAQQQNAAAVSGRAVGTVKAIAGNALVMTTDAGAELNVTPAEAARMIRTVPGQKDLAAAPSITFQEIQVGDRVLLKGQPSADGKSLLASSIVVMKKSDIADKQAKEREDWQKRGVGGRVTAIDQAAGTITLSLSGMTGKQTVAVRTSSSTIVRRYARDSVKFDNAVLSALDQIKTGDQLRARGNKNAEGTELNAEEIVAGSFRNIAGTVLTTDAAKQSFTVKDLETKKPVTIKVTADSQMHKLPAMMAQFLAMQVKGLAAGQNGAGTGNRIAMGPGAAATRNGSPTRSGDISQMLSSLPVVTVGELQKGDAVMIVTTQGTDAEVSAITLLSGVEPILTASPDANSMILSPWSLSAGGGEGGGGAGGPQ